MSNWNGQSNRKQTSNLKQELGDLGADVITLSELQLELIAVDSRDAMRQSIYPTLLTCIALGFIIGACPVALLGLSWWLNEVTELSRAASFLIVAGIGFTIAVALLFYAWKGFQKSFTLLNRSRTELRSNIQWIKKILSKKHRQQQIV